jgi:hypothetical protein
LCCTRLLGTEAEHRLDHLPTRRVAPPIGFLLIAAYCVLALGGWLGWLNYFQSPRRPWFGARLLAPRTTRLADLTVVAPAGYVLIPESDRVRVERLWPAISYNDISQSLQIRVAESPEALSSWTTKEHECGSRPSGCRVRVDTVRGREIRCRELARASTPPFDTLIVSACRASGTRYWSLHTCNGVARCEVLHRTAIAALGSFAHDSSGAITAVQSR